MSIKKYFEMTPFPLINVVGLKRNLLPIAILVRFDRFWIYLFKGVIRVYLYRSSMESHFIKMRGVADINKHQLDWPQSASVAVSEPHTAPQTVNYLSINSRKRLLY